MKLFSLHNEHRLRYSSSALLHYDLLAMAPLNSRGSNFAKGGWFISFHCNYFGCLSLSFHSFINIHPGIHSIVFYWWAIQCTIPKGWEIAVEPLLTISRTSANCCVFISSAVPPVKSSAPHQPHRSTPHTNQTSNPNTMMIILTTYTPEIFLYFNQLIAVLWEERTRRKILYFLNAFIGDPTAGCFLIKFYFCVLLAV